MQISFFSTLLPLFILLCGCDKATPEPSGKKDRSISDQPSTVSGQETALGVRKMDLIKTAKVTEPNSEQEQPLPDLAVMVEEASESSRPGVNPITLQTPTTRSAARVTAMQEFEALRASPPAQPEDKSGKQ